jgi:CTD nuclear envelope phosphatase 1
MKVSVLNHPMAGTDLLIWKQDNAIPIEGWISDPTDNDLLNLIPLLEGLQYATDVRALLALRLGQPQDTVS